MMKNKLLVFLVFLFVVFGFLFSANFIFAETMVSSSPVPEKQFVNSYELFWPVVAGKVRGDSMYFLKSLKESLRELITFSTYKKVDYNILLSEKRTVEAEKLILDNKNDKDIDTTLSEAQKKREKAHALLARINQDTKPLIGRLRSSLERQQALLIYLRSESDKYSEIIIKNLDSLNSTLAKLN